MPFGFLIKSTQTFRIFDLFSSTYFIIEDNPRFVFSNYRCIFGFSFHHEYFLVTCPPIPDNINRISGHHHNKYSHIGIQYKLTILLKIFRQLSHKTDLRSSRETASLFLLQLQLLHAPAGLLFEIQLFSDDVIVF